MQDSAPETRTEAREPPRDEHTRLLRRGKEGTDGVFTSERGQGCCRSWSGLRTHARMPVDEFRDVLERARLEVVLQLSAATGADPPPSEKWGGEVRRHGSEAGVDCLLTQKVRVSNLRLRKRSGDPQAGLRLEIAQVQQELDELSGEAPKPQEGADLLRDFTSGIRDLPLAKQKARIRGFISRIDCNLPSAADSVQIDGDGVGEGLFRNAGARVISRMSDRPAESVDSAGLKADPCNRVLRFREEVALVARGGFEPPTSRL